MKHVLIIDAPPLFREFLKEKLITENVTVEIANGKRDAFTKLVSLLPDLVIIDAPERFTNLTEFLEKKRNDPNAVSIPVIVTGPILSREEIAKLPYYHVVKYFNKPIKFDIFFESIGRLIKTPLSIDTTPCILETHLNNNIIFIEIAQGLNREKLALLKYKITEIIDNNKLSNPKIILMMTDLSLSFVDGANLELLLDNVIADNRVQRKNVKILSLDSFTKELINGHLQYKGIEVAENLTNILSALVAPDNGDVTDTISDRILASTGDASEGSVEMRFYSESGILEETEETDSKKIKVAIIDDDAVIRRLLQTAFGSINAECELFDSGAEFLVATNRKKYDLIILDIFMPGISGFDILINLHNKKYLTPVIVYSNATQREAVIQALSLGAKSYLIKPLKPEAILQKAVEVLQSKF